METVKPLTWEEAKDQVVKPYKYWKRFFDECDRNSDLILLEDKLDEAAELYASSRVRTLEEEVSKLERHVSENANTALLLISRNEELELELDRVKEENKRLQERLEAADKIY